jgi:hypothetical protein
MSQAPARADLESVHAVLNKQPRKRQITDNYKSIDVLMQIAPSSTGNGPDWFYLDSGDLTASVIAAAKLARQIATRLQDMAGEIGQLSIPADDRRNLVAALNAQAASWDARAASWVTTGKPQVSATVSEITGHQREAFDAAHKVRAYLNGNR